MAFSNKKIGNGFERAFELSARLKGWIVVKLPDGCKRITQQKIIFVKCPFDFVLAKDKLAIFCDVKTCEGKTFPHSKINQSQANHLFNLHEQGMKSGYIVYFRESKAIAFFSADQLVKLSPRESLTAGDGTKLGTLGSFDLELLTSGDHE